MSVSDFGEKQIDATAQSESPERLKGTVKWFNDAKGFGFIEHPSGKDVFVHYSIIESEGFKTLKDGEPVEYELKDGSKGLHAARVIRAAQPAQKASRSNLQIEVIVENDTPSNATSIVPEGASPSNQMPASQIPNPNAENPKSAN